MDDLPFGVGVVPSRLHAGLLLGDVAVIVLLLGAGMVRHRTLTQVSEVVIGPVGALGPLVLSLPLRALLVIGPFVVSWLVVATLTGAYTVAVRRSTVDAAVNAVGTWLVAALVGAGLRSLPMLPGRAPVTFLAVVVGFGAVGLAVWRGAVTYVVGPAER